MKILLLTFLFYSICFAQKFSVKEVVHRAEIQVSNQLNNNNDPAVIPRSTDENGELKYVDIYDWTSGFFAGTLWNLYELTGDKKWIDDAKRWTEALEDLQYLKDHHDVGFMLMCSFGNGLRLMRYPEYKQIIINGAESLSSRFNPVVGAIKSWNVFKSWDGENVYHYPVIVDNMMNLELLFRASELSGDEKYKEIAITHARTTMENHYRDDFSSYHVVCYDSYTGEVLAKETAQGFSDESSWARGQAWGLYGFVICYRETGLKEFLEQAENIADFIINHPNMPEDEIPFWDYNADQSGFIPQWNYERYSFDEIPRDASAAAITASALLELSTYSENGNQYKLFADKILNSLSSPEYLAEPGENNNFILKHSVGSIPHGFEVDSPINYTDYYFLEALIRKNKIETNVSLFK